MCATITDETQCEAHFTPQRTTMAAAQTHHGQHRYTYRTCGRGQSEAGRFPGPRPEIHSFPMGGRSRRQTTRGLAGGVMPAPVYSPAVGRARLGAGGHPFRMNFIDRNDDSSRPSVAAGDAPCTMMVAGGELSRNSLQWSLGAKMTARTPMKPSTTNRQYVAR